MTLTVPAVVPSVFHSSPPSATKNIVLPTIVKSAGLSPFTPPTSVTIVVPAVVPSLFHSWVPSMPSLAVKNSDPLNTVICCGSI